MEVPSARLVSYYGPRLLKETRGALSREQFRQLANLHNIGMEPQRALEWVFPSRRPVPDWLIKWDIREREGRSNWYLEKPSERPLEERLRYCLASRRGRGRCSGPETHNVLDRWPCKVPWCENCRSHTLIKLLMGTTKQDIPGYQAVMGALGQNVSLWKIVRETSLEGALENAGAWLTKARSQLDDAVKRWGRRVGLFHRGDRIEVDPTALWPGPWSGTRSGICRVIRYVLAAGDATGGRTKGLRKLLEGPTSRAVAEYFEQVGGSWSTDKVTESSAEVLVNALKGRHRVKALRGFASVLAEVELRKPCWACGAPLKYCGPLTEDHRAVLANRPSGRQYWSWAAA